MADGYFRLPRAIRDCGFWPKTRRYTPLEALLDLRLSARYGKTPGKEFIGGRMITIPTDGYLTSQVKLAARWKWNRRTVSNFLCALSRLEILHIETVKGVDHGYTLITFVNSIASDADDESEFSAENEEKYPSSAHRVHITEDSKRHIASRRYQYVGDSEDSEEFSEGIPEGVSSSNGSDRAELERAVIGAMLLEPDLIAEISTILKPANFHTAGLAKLFEIFLALSAERRPVDLLTVDSELRAQKIQNPTTADLAQWADEKASPPDVVSQARVLAKVNS